MCCTFLPTTYHLSQCHTNKLKFKRWIQNCFKFGKKRWRLAPLSDLALYVSHDVYFIGTQSEQIKSNWIQREKREERSNDAALSHIFSNSLNYTAVHSEGVYMHCKWLDRFMEIQIFVWNWHLYWNFYKFVFVLWWKDSRIDCTHLQFILYVYLYLY